MPHMEKGMGWRWQGCHLSRQLVQEDDSPQLVLHSHRSRMLMRPSDHHLPQFLLEIATVALLHSGLAIQQPCAQHSISCRSPVERPKKLSGNLTWTFHGVTRSG